MLGAGNSGGATNNFGHFRIQPWTAGYSTNATTYTASPRDKAVLTNGVLTYDTKYTNSPINAKPLTGTVNPFSTLLANGAPYASAHSGGGANVVMCDGSVRFLSERTPLDVVLRPLAARADGGVIPDN